MKLKTIVKASVVLGLVGILCTGIGYTMNDGFNININGNEFTNEDNINNVSYVTKNNVKLNEFNNVNIDLEDMNVNFIPSDEYKIDISYDKNKSNFEYEVIENTLNIIQSGNGISGLNFSSDLDKSYINVYFKTDEVFNNINISSSASNINIEKVKSDNLEIDCSAGNIELEESEIKDIKLNAHAGNVEVKNVEALRIDSSGNVGNIIFENCEVKEGFTSKNDLGNTEIGGKLYGYNNIETNLGNIVIDIDEDIKKYNVKVNNKLGFIDVDNKSYSRNMTTSSKDENSLNIDCSAGNIELNFK